jgi:release factor glutamine methyltransferase
MEVAAYFDFAKGLLEKKYPREEAENLLFWIFEDTLLIKKAHIRLFSKELGELEITQVNNILERLLAGEPLQYIYGYAYFKDLVLAVSNAVLIPRPETEELVNWAEESLDADPSLVGVLDICTGSGCIALSLKKHYPNNKVSAIDVSESALKIAQKNANQLQLNVAFELGDILDPLGQEKLISHAAQVWLCNPPYIAEAEKQSMHENVLKYEPHLALFVPNNDPLLFYRIVSNCFMKNEYARFLFFEISEFQEESLKIMLNDLNIKYSFKKDLQSKTRMLRLSK